MACPNCGHHIPLLKEGDVVQGFCHGLFGRDSYGDKTVLAVGKDWVLLEETYQRGRYPDYEAVRVLHTYDGNPDDLLEYVDSEN
jgi:hypothetical protein